MFAERHEEETALSDLEHNLKPMDIDSRLPKNGRQEQLRTRLIESIYSTITDQNAWPAFLRELVTCSESRSARLLVMNPEATRVISSIKLNIDDNYHRQYVEHYVNTCPWRPELRRKPPGRLYSTYLHFSCRQPEFCRSEFFNDWASPQDIHHGVCGTIFHNSGRSVQLLVQRTRDQGHYSEAETDFFNNLIPHLQHSFLLGAQVTDGQARAEAIAQAAGGEALPFVLLDLSLHLTYCNPNTEALITAEPGLTIINGQLRISDDLRNQRLQRLLRECLAASATRSFHAAGGTIAVPRPCGSALQLLVKPVHPDIPILADETTGYVAVYLYNPQAEIHLDGEKLSRLYSLSEAETRVAMAMVVTPDLPAVAKQCGISLHTVRSHLKAIFAKTDTHNQAGLMKRLLTGPARQRMGAFTYDHVN